MTKRVFLIEKKIEKIASKSPFENESSNLLFFAEWDKFTGLEQSFNDLLILIPELLFEPVEKNEERN